MSDVQVTTVPKELYYHEVAYVRGLEARNAELVAALEEARAFIARGYGDEDAMCDRIDAALAAAGRKP